MLILEIISFSAVGINLLFALVQLFRWQKHKQHKVLFFLFVSLAFIQLELSLYATQQFHLVPYLYCVNMPFIALLGPLLLWYLRLLRSTQESVLWHWGHFLFPVFSVFLYSPWILLSKAEKVRYIQHEYTSANSLDSSLDILTILVLLIFLAYAVLIFIENHRASYRHQRLSLLWVLLIAVNALIAIAAISLKQMFLFHLAEVTLPISLLVFLALTQIYPQLIHLSENSEPSLWLRSEGREMRINFSEIIFVQAHRNQCVIHTTRGEHTTSISLKQLVTRVQSNHFFRSHKSYLINLQFVSHVRHDQAGNYLAYLSDDDDSVLPVSRKNAKEMRNRIKSG